MKKAVNNVADGAGENFFQQILVKYLPYWPIFLVLLVLFQSLAILYINFTAPIYESTASILIKDEKKGQEDSKMEELLNLLESHKSVENELEILRSNEVIHDVVIKMKLYAPVYTETGWHGMIQRSAYFTSPVIVEAADPSQLKESSKVYFTVAPDSSKVLVEGVTYRLAEWVKSPWGSIRFIKNPVYSPDSLKNTGDIKYYFNLIELVNEIDALKEGLVASPTSKQSSVVTLKLKDAVPERGEAILSNIVNSYNTNAVRKKSELASNTLSFIEERLKSVKAQLDSIDNGIQRYRNKAGVVDISAQSQLYLQNVARNDQQRNQIKIQMNVLDQLEKYLETRDDEGNVVPTALEINDPTLTQLMEKLHNSQAEYGRLRKTTAENNPILSSIKADITRTKGDILETVRSLKSSLKESQNYVDKISMRDSAMVYAIPQKEKDLVEASRQRTTTADIYSYLLQKREEVASYGAGSIMPDSYIVDRATSTQKPVSPKKSLVILLAVILPLMLGAALVSIKQFFSNKILYRSDIESLTSYPVIGEIIQGKFEYALVTAAKERSFIIEQFRLLRSAIRNLSNPPGQVRRIAVTSSIEGEGKSFVAANLANSIAKSSKRVALLELDLHQPSICEMLGLEREIGITDYLLGKAKEDEIFMQTPFNPDLYFISAGNLNEDASELLLNGKIEQLLDWLSNKVDVIVMDMPPINPITDVFVVSQFSDYVLYVIRHGRVPKNNIRLLREIMESHNIKNIALVFNGIKKRGIGKYSYGYGYGYGYDYKSSYDTYGKSRKKKSA